MTMCQIPPNFRGHVSLPIYFASSVFPTWASPKTSQSSLWFTRVHDIFLMLFHLSVLVESCWLQSAFEQPLWENAASVFSILSYNVPKAAKISKQPNTTGFLSIFTTTLEPCLFFAEMRKCLFPTSALDIANLAPISWNFLANSHRRLALQAFSLILQTESLGQAVKWTRNCPLHLFLSGPMNPHTKLFFSVFIFHLAPTNGYWSWVV